MKFLDYVNIRMGTDTTPLFSNGNTLPMTSLPFGMNNFLVETRGHNPLEIFNATDRVTTGIRLTHCSNRWLGDYGFLTFMPRSESSKAGICSPSSFVPEKTEMNPHEINVDFQIQRAKVSLTPAQRSAIVKVHYYDAHGCRSMLLKLFCGAEISVNDDGIVTGKVCNHFNEVPENFGIYFAISFDKKIDVENTAFYTHHGQRLDAVKEAFADNIFADIALCGAPDDFEMRIATSFISTEQARQNLKELDGKTYDDVKSAAIEKWEEILHRIEIEAEEEVKKTFYSCLYRMFLFPRNMCEYDKNDAQKHYSPADGKIYDGPLYSDNGFWDTYKTVYPLYSIIASDEYRDMCDGFLNFYKESGWLPRWMDPGAVDCMPGTSIDNLFADAVEKGVVTDKATIELMLESMLRHATTESPEPKYGREGIADYIKYHYVTRDHRESVNKTQDYAYGDFSIAKIAEHLGKDDLAKEFYGRSLYYRNIFNTEKTFMLSRDKDGNERDDWTQFDWGGDYTEGGPWQNSFAVFHDFAGLAEMMGGKDKMIEKMDKLFDTPPLFNGCGYGGLIHEMSEMASVDFGQCALSNQPSFHIPYIYSYMGAPEKTAYWVRKACKELFNSGYRGYPGDEDNGSTSGWYVFSALGFYPVCPSVAEYVVGSPTVSSAVIHTDSGKDFVIKAEGNSDENVYVSKMLLDGREYHKTFVSHGDIKAGGELVFKMTSEPVFSEYAENELPYSLSKNK